MVPEVFDILVSLVSIFVCLPESRWNNGMLITYLFWSIERAWYFQSKRPTSSIDYTTQSCGVH